MDDVEHASRVVVLKSAQYPEQHACPGEQLWPVFLQSGESQKQDVPPLQATSWFVARSMV